MIKSKRIDAALAARKDATPGPWDATERIDTTTQTLAAVWGNDGDCVALVYSGYEGIDYLEAIDRARLIAAAPDMAAEIVRLRAQIAVLKNGIMAVDNLINNSEGVYGLHLNGDPAPWETLRSGAYFEDWLREFDDAVAATKLVDAL